MNRKLVLLGMFAMLSLFVSTQLFSQEDDIKKRKSLMKSTSKASKAIKGAVKEGDFATVESNAKKIAKNMDSFASHFPEGSTAKNSRAKAAIWDDWDDFKGKTNKLKSSARQLVNAASAQDLAQVKTEYKAVGKACGSCHKPYRAKKKKKR